MKELVRRGLRSIGYELRRRPEPQSPEDKWPNKSDRLVEFETILMFTSPNSGSTAISEYLLTSKRVASFAKRSEGQWLIPGLCDSDRWWPGKPVSYKSIAGTLNKVGQAAVRENGDVDLFVEKSPPNMVRSDKLLSIFQKKRIIINNRDPYANIASQLKRYSKTQYAHLERAETTAYLAEQWLYRSQFLVEIAEKHKAPIMTYEQFCEQPKRVLDALELSELDAQDSQSITVKDYDTQPITNMNSKQIDTLSPSEIELISKTLSSRKDLVNAFSYEIL